MKIKSKFLIFTCLSSLFSNVSLAQETALGQAVSAAPNSTALQVATGEAVQQTCLQLVPKYANSIDPTQPAKSGEEALFLRCSDMVGTALGLVGAPGIGTDLGWSNAQLAEGQQQLSGEEQLSKGRVATENSNGQYANIGMRLDAIRAGARATAGGLNVAMNGVPITGGNAGEDGTGWGWFFNGAVGNGDRDATTQEDKYDYDSYGATLGFDYQFQSGLVAGFALGYSDYDVEFKSVNSFQSGPQLTTTQSGGGFETDGYALSGYAIGNIGRFYIDGLLSYGMTDMQTERIVQYSGSQSGSGTGQGLVVDRSMLGETDSDTLTLGISTGTDFEFSLFDLGVSAGLSYLDVSVDGYTEKDRARGADTAQFSGLNLAYEDQDFDSLQSSLGFQLSKVFSISTGVIVPYFNADWRYEFKNDPVTTKARYAAQQTGQVFNLNIRSDDPDEDFFELGVGISAVFANNLQAFIDYRTTVDLDNVSAELITIGVRGSF
jgi:uncharacterized protein YhjY with autotransporter beta-barrel domain